MDLQRFKDEIIILREKLQRFARGMLSNEVDAEDAVQETYLRLWNVRERLSEHPNVGGFAMQTLKNVCLDKLKKNNPNLPFDNIEQTDNSRTPDVYTEERDSMQIIRSIVATLPELQRQILTMRDIDGYELDEIAEIMGANESAVRVNLSRARKKVRERYISISKIKMMENEKI